MSDFIVGGGTARVWGKDGGECRPEPTSGFSKLWLSIVGPWEEVITELEMIPR